MSIIEPTHDPLKELRQHIDAAHKILHEHANALRIGLLKEKEASCERAKDFSKASMKVMKQNQKAAEKRHKSTND